MAIEDELKTCPACAGEGIVDGDRCAECAGRGITRFVPVARLFIPELDTAPEEDEDEGDGLDTMILADLRERADLLGLSAEGDREALIKRIRKGRADPPTIAEDEAPADGLDRLTVAQLRERAEELGIESTGRKADLLALIRGALASREVSVA